jgi:predicted PurR-regulated permease PerM
VVIGAIIVLKFDKIAALINTIWSATRPLFIGIIVALILNVPMKFIEKLLKKIPTKKKRWVRPIAVVLTYLLALALIAIVSRIVIPQVITSMGSLLANSSSYLTSATKSLNNFFSSLGLSFRIDISNLTSLAQIEKLINEWFKTLSSLGSLLSDGIIGNITEAAKVVFSTLLATVAAFLISIYVLLAKEKYVRICKQILQRFLPAKLCVRCFSLYRLTIGIFNNFVGGFLTEMCILGTLFYIVLTISGMPYALLISVVIAITSIMPYVGTTFAMIFGAFLILADRGLWTMVVFIIEFTIVQQVENNLIYPHVVGKSVGIPSFYVLLAITIFGSLFGIMGLLVAVPLMALIYTLLKNAVHKGKALPDVPVLKNQSKVDITK